MQARFQVRDQETVIETASVDVADGKGVMARLRNMIVSAITKEHMVLQ